MWSVACISGLIFLVIVSAGMHIGANKDPLQLLDRVQLQAEETETEFHHHHIQEIEKISHTYLGEPTIVVRRRAVSQNLRIHAHYDPDTIPQLLKPLRDLIKNVLIKEAVDYFKNTLKVRSVKTPIILYRTCTTDNIKFIRNADGVRTPYCNKGCEKNSFCGIVTIPEEHLKGCHKMSQGRGVKEGDDGPGVDADYILYISAKTTRDCTETTLAYARTCQLEQAMDRPVTGQVNFCPENFGMFVTPQKRRGAIAAVKHEIIHALAFSPVLYPFYRDKRGNPLTERGYNGLPPLIRGIPNWSSNVIKQFKRPGWKTVTMMVTPAVVREARRHFGCDSLEGAELEDQDVGPVGTHWELRVFQNEVMTGQHTQNRALSRVTLALLEDTGWYKVNYKMAEPLLYGFGKGCDFVKKSCKDYMELKRHAGQSVSPYCDIPEAKQCLAEYNGIAICHIFKYPSAFDAKIQPFTSIDGVNDTDVPFYGGTVAFADYCPFWMKPLRYTNRNATRIGDTLCRFAGNQIDDNKNYWRETYSAESVCFKHKREKWILKMRNCTHPCKAFPYGSKGAGCYRIKCGTAEVDGFKVYVNANEFECLTEGQEVAVHGQNTVYTYNGTLICPPYKLVCQNLTAPRFPGDDDAWKGDLILPGTEPDTQPGGGATTNANDIGTVGLVESERSGTSAQCLGWVIIIFTIFVQMTLSSYLQMC